MEKELSAYANDTSEESRAKIQQKKVDLEEAKNDLNETEYEHYISEQKKMLDNLYDEYESILNAKLDDTDTLIRQLIDDTNANVTTIKTAIEDAANKVGYTPTAETSDIWSVDTSIPDFIGDVDGDGQITAADARLVLRASSGLESLTPEQQEAADINRDGVVTAADARQILRISAKLENLLTNKVVTYYEGIATNVSGVKNTIDSIEKYVKDIATKPSSSVSSVTGKLAGHANGGFIAEAQKAALKNGDDIVTVNTLKQGEAVLTPEQAIEFSKLVDSLPRFEGLFDASKYLSKISEPRVERIGNSIGDISINIPIEHVDGYNDFINQLKHDRRSQEFIRSITIDLAAKKSPLAKNKY